MSMSNYIILACTIGALCAVMWVDFNKSSSILGNLTLNVIVSMTMLIPFFMLYHTGISFYLSFATSLGTCVAITFFPANRLLYIGILIISTFTLSYFLGLYAFIFVILAPIIFGLYKMTGRIPA